ncbi:MAG TPA: hypothetical protein VND42_03025 [Candidatus Acidoferrales bacterium]|nr:hypothetical protein [Candidatus Acidoferrales bacterium]
MSASKVSAPPTSVFLLLVFGGTLFLAGCAAPGQPITRRPPAPTPITDLSAQQFGDSVALSFALPKQTVQGRPLTHPPRVEIYREYVSASAPNRTSAQLLPPQRLILTVPSQSVDQYREGEHIRFSDQLSAADISAHAGDQAVYMVRTRISKHDSANSNLATVKIFPAPPPISDLHAQVTRSAIELSWTAPEVPSAGTLRPISVHYRIYRANNVTAPTSAPITNTSPAPSGAASLLFGQVAEISSPPYQDADFSFGQTYAYYVVSVARYNGGAVESHESKIIEVTPRDTFPPAAPMGLVAAVAPATASGPAHVDLSWDISSATDVAGYNVYRSGTNAGSTDRWDRLTSSPLLTPAFRDIPEAPGKHYFYRVTAVDRFGNESAPSPLIDVDVPATNE